MKSFKDISQNINDFSKWEELFNQQEKNTIIEQAEIIVRGSLPKEKYTIRESKSLASVYNKVWNNIKMPNIYYSKNKMEFGIVEDFTENQIVLKEVENDFRDMFEKLEKWMNTSKETNELIEILEEYGSRIPFESTEEFEDISLFNHAKLVGAVASCIERKKVSSKNINEELFLLVSGDISGIQSFIYNVVNKQAMKSLRGRSFYLDMILEHIIDELLESNNLNRCNLLYSGGGHFYMVLPNDDIVKKNIDMLSKSVNDWFLKEFSTAIYLAVAWQECSGNDIANDLNSTLKEKNLSGEVFSKVSKKISNKKLKRYDKETLMKLFNHETEKDGFRDELRECPSCKHSRNIDKEDQNCSFCNGLIQLGKMISKSYNEKEKYIALVIENKDVSEKYNMMPLPKINRDCGILIVDEKSESRYIGDIIRKYTINKINFDNDSAFSIEMGNYNFESNDSEGLIEFKELIGNEIGIERLAVMRADVDNLGELFVRGLYDETEKSYRYANLARYSVVSRSLSMFFKKYINYIADGKFSFEASKRFCTDENKKIVIVYAGGDDLFVVGNWQDVFDFSIDLYNAFKEFTNGKLTFSAGIGFFKEGYPIYHMAQVTGELESLAKGLDGKNGIALFGKGINYEENHVYKWDEFIENIIDEKLLRLRKYDQMLKNQKLSGLSSGKLYEILSLLRKQKKDNEGIHIARLAYQIARMQPENMKDLEIEFEEFKKDIMRWSMNKVESEQLMTAIILFVYERREKEAHNGTNS